MKIGEHRVRELLKLLREHGLAERKGTGRWGGQLATLKDMDRIAATLGVAGSSTKQHEKFKQERKASQNNMLLRNRKKREKRVSLRRAS